MERSAMKVYRHRCVVCGEDVPQLTGECFCLGDPGIKRHLYFYSDG